ncbi:carcinoembryonic antigen-related cell adhesion molecule 6-like [Scomber scombrus]
MLLLLPDILCNILKVEYQQQHICAVKGSSAVIQCSFHHTDNLVKKVQWGHETNNSSKGHSNFNIKYINTSSRFLYIGDKNRNCSLKIHQVNHDDKGLYATRFITSNKRGTWPVRIGPMLKVVDLNILMTNPHGNEAVKEGESANLTCINSCDGLNVTSAFTWFKNGEPIKEGPVLNLRNMSSSSSGNYTCSLKTNTGTTSGVKNIDVEYSPKNTSVSVSPSLEVDPDSNVTLICSSHAKPPVENYTWFKIHDNYAHMTAVGHKPVFFPSNVGQYLCSVTNTHGSQNSSVVTLKMKVYWATATRDILIIAVAVILVVTTVIAITRLNNNNTRAPTTDCGENIQVAPTTLNTESVNWLICDDHQQEANQCEGRTTELIYGTVVFKPNRESNMQQTIHTYNDDDEGVIYSTVCRSQQLNPSCFTS